MVEVADFLRGVSLQIKEEPAVFFFLIPQNAFASVQLAACLGHQSRKTRGGNGTFPQAKAA
jgi:hypothetical protein